MKMEQSYLTLVPNGDKLVMDVMFGDRWGGQVTLKCTPGIEYAYDELKAFARLVRPSLAGKEFSLYPTGKPRFSDGGGAGHRALNKDDEQMRRIFR